MVLGAFDLLPIEKQNMLKKEREEIEKYKDVNYFENVLIKNKERWMNFLSANKGIQFLPTIDEAEQVQSEVSYEDICENNDNGDYYEI